GGVRHRGLQKPQLEQQREAFERAGAASELKNLRYDPGLAAPGDGRRDFEEGLPRGGLEMEAEAGGEVDRPDHAHGVFAEARRRFADRADDATLEVRDAVDEVDDPLVLHVVEEAVDREVAAPRVVLDRAPLVVVGDEEVLVARVRRRGAERAGLDDLMAEEDVDELEPTPNDPAVAKQLANRFGRRARRD